jgi:hypothetical protein
LLFIQIASFIHSFNQYLLCARHGCWLQVAQAVVYSHGQVKEGDRQGNKYMSLHVRKMRTRDRMLWEHMEEQPTLESWNCLLPGFLCRIRGWASEVDMSGGWENPYLPGNFTWHLCKETCTEIHLSWSPRKHYNIKLVWNTRKSQHLHDIINK